MMIRRRLYFVHVIFFLFLNICDGFSFFNRPGFAQSIRLFSISTSTSWRNDVVPSGFSEASKLMSMSLLEILSSNDSSFDESTGVTVNRTRLVSVDMLTPGLNPKLEQKAMLMQEYLFNLVQSITVVLDESKMFRSVLLMFPSTGDAAGYRKYCSQIQQELPDWVTLTDVDFSRVQPHNDCVVFVTSRNHVGDPVISTIQQIVSTFPTLTYIFLNCDLSDRVTSGIIAHDQRDRFRASIRPAFYFRNIVQIVRPTLVPIELGALMYTPQKGWAVYGVNNEDIVGPGSLNRFMKVGVFARNKADPTEASPPRFIEAANVFGSGVEKGRGKEGVAGWKMPTREHIDAAMSRVAFVAAQAERQEEQEKKREQGGNKEIRGQEQTVTQKNKSWWPWS